MGETKIVGWAVAACGVALACVMAVSVDAAQDRRRTLGFVLTDFGPALDPGGADDCPNGPAQTPQQMYLATAGLTAQEKQRLLRPENGRELLQLATKGPNGVDLCRAPETVTHLPLNIIEGKTAVGLDLDGAPDGGVSQGTCAHDQFVSPDGKHGIDNQFYRAIGCVRFYGQGDYARLVNSFMAGGEFTIVMELRGVDDLHNDRDVEVGIYNSSDPAFTDSNGHILPDSSLRVVVDAKYHNELRGRIVDGVLTTEPADIRLGFSQAAKPSEYYFRAARFRLELRKDGTIGGLMGAYRDVENIQAVFATHGAGAAAVTSLDCPGLHAALVRVADGYRDSRTGRCTAVSVAHHVEGIPAFVVHPSLPAAGPSARAGN